MTAKSPRLSHILVLHSYSQEYPWTRRQHEGFLQALNQGLDTDFEIEADYLDSKRRTYEPDYAKHLTDFLSIKYRDYTPDAIYVTDDNALDFALNHLYGMFPGVPVFFSGVNDYTVLARIAGRPVTGVFEKKEIAPNLDLLAAMGHSAGEMAIVGDASNTYRAIEREIRIELTGHPSIKATFVSHDRMDLLLQDLRRYPRHDLFLTTLGQIHDEHGATLPLEEVIRQISEQAPRLIVSMEDAYLFDGVLGGYVTSGQKQGAAAAGLMISYLKGQGLPPPIADSPNEYVIDARQLAQHGLALPDSLLQITTLLNQPPTFYQHYRNWILGALYLSVSLLFVSITTFLVLLARKNRQIQNRSVALRNQARIALSTNDRLNEAQRLARQGSWDWDLINDEFTISEGLGHLYTLPLEIPRTTIDSFLDALDTDMRENFEHAVNEVRTTGNRLEYIHKLQHKKGEVHILRETIRLFSDEHGAPRRLIGTVQDVTDQVLSERRLRESEEKYRRLFELSEDPMWLIVGHKFVMANHAASRVLGYDDIEQLVDTHPALLSPDFQHDGQASRSKADEMMEIAIRDGYHRFEWIHRKRDGSLFPVEVSLTRIPYEGEDALFCIWRDITEIKRIQQELEEKSTYLDGILSSSEKVAIIATNPEGIVQYYNPPAEKLFGVATDKALGSNLVDLHHARGVDDSRNKLGLDLARTQGEYRFTFDLTRDDGTHIIDARVSPISKQNDDFAGYMLMCEDVTDQRRATALIEYQASYDALTDLPNRRMFMDHLQHALARTRRHSHKGAVLFFDLDNFKTINDSLGHTVGDDLLRQVARRMKKTVREEDTVARLGGDEFVLLMPELAKDPEEALLDVQTVADKVRHCIGLPFNIDMHELHVTTSIGIAVFPSANETTDDILRQADTAMYRAKESGRNAVRFFLPSMQKAAEERLEILNQLRQAMPRNELQIYFQPQFNDARELCGAEALLRWVHPKRGLIVPDAFIPLAEESGLILEMGDWVLHQALTRLREWHTKPTDNYLSRMAVNVSALQFRQPDFVDRVERALGQTGAAPSCLTLEMTESILLEDFDETVDKMRALKRLGVRFSLDDFGTGYSSLAYLKRLPLDEIKIDRSFVRDVLVDPSDAALVDAILTLARHISLDVVAEGVESEEVFGFLCERGCHVFQGYHFGRPCVTEQFADKFLSAAGSSPPDVKTSRH